MSDTMVTARMSQAKKEAGNRVLDQMGSNASQFINSAYDYLIQHGASPFDIEAKQASTINAKDIAWALAQVEEMCLPQDNRFKGMTDDEIRGERLMRHGFELR